MQSHRVAEILQQNIWFQSLKPDHFQKLVEIAQERSWAEDEIIFSEGDLDDSVFLILEGLVALDILISGQGRATILTLGPTEIFGWSAVTPVVGTRLASARAVMPTQAIEFDSKALRRICDEDHDLGYHVYRRLTNVMAGRLSATRLQLIDMYARRRE